MPVCGVEADVENWIATDAGESDAEDFVDFDRFLGVDGAAAEEVRFTTMLPPKNSMWRCWKAEVLTMGLSKAENLMQKLDWTSPT